MTTDRSTAPATQPTTVASWVVAAAITGTVLIALGAFWLSFTALTDLAVRAGIAGHQAWVWPLIVDGIIIVATISVVALAPYGRRATIYPWTLLIVGAIVSVAGNATHATVAADTHVSGLLAACIASVPPLVLLAITHLTVQLSQTSHRHHAQPTSDGPADTHVRHRSLPPDVRRAASGRRVPHSRGDRRAQARAFRDQGWTNSRIAAELGVHPSTIGRWLTAGPTPETG